jgi:DNA-binding cell septation regulator SpoVG
MIRDKVLKYLYESNFVTSYTKKLVYPSDKENLQDDFIQEVWLQLCEIPEKKWEELYNRRTNQDEFYDVRNWVSVLIRNTVVSTTSSAYRKLKKQNTVAKQLSWLVYQ